MAPLIRDIPNASLAWKLNAPKRTWVSMLFNINNQTNHYWMSFVYVHFVCVFEHWGTAQHGHWYYCLDPDLFYTILICCFFIYIFLYLLFATGIVRCFFSTPILPIWSSHSVARDEGTQHRVANRSPFTNWTLKVRMENHLSWETHGNQPHELPLELSLKATGESREQKSHESQQAAPHAQVRVFFFWGGGSSRPLFFFMN